MLVTVGANCWNGVRSKTLSESFKVEVVQKQTFMDRLKVGTKRLNDPKVKMVLGYALPLILLSAGLPPLGLGHVFAHSIGGPEAIPVISSVASAKILHAFDPLINMIQLLAYPIAGVMIAGGCLFIMTGQKEKGMGMLQNAALGYILVQLSPMLLSLLVGVGSTVM